MLALLYYIVTSYIVVWLAGLKLRFFGCGAAGFNGHLSLVMKFLKQWVKLVRFLANNFDFFEFNQ